MDLESIIGVEATAFEVLSRDPFTLRGRKDPLDHLHIILFPLTTDNNKNHLILVKRMKLLFMKHTLVRDDIK